MTVKLFPPFRFDYRIVSSSRKFYCALLLLFLLPVFSAHAQTATVYGQVTDTTGRGIRDANVSFIGNTVAPVIADINGKYSLEIPAGKKVTVVFSLLGYSSERFTVILNPGDKYKLDMQLDALNLATAIIEDYRNRTVTGITVPFEPWKYMPSPNADPLRIVTTLGANTNNELSSQYSVRGGNFDENLIYINDFEVYRPFLTRSGQQEGLSIVNGDMVDHLFFSAGGFTANYGDKMSSVLDISYRRPTEFAANVSASLLGGSFEVEDVSRDERFRWMLGARQKSNRYLLNKLDTRGDYFARFTDVQANMTYDFTENVRLEYLGNYAVNQYTLQPESRETEFGTLNEALRFTVYFEGQEKNRFTTGFNAASLTVQNNQQGKPSSAGMKLIFSAFGTLEDETYDVLGQYYLDELETDFGKDEFGEVAFNRGVGSFLNHARNYLDAWVTNAEVRGWKGFGTDTANHKLSFGLKYQNERINDELSEWNYVDSAGFSIPISPPESIDLQDVIKTKNSLNSNRIVGYLMDEWKWQSRDSSNFTITYGIRANYWDLNNQIVFNPRTTFAWKPHWKADIVFKAAGGLYQQPPFYRELRDLSGMVNRDVKAQTSVHAVVGSDLSFLLWNRQFRFIAEGYYKYLDNLVPYVVNDVRIRYLGDNMARGYAYGVDLKINGQFVNGAESWVNLSFLRTREDLYGDRQVIYLNSDGDTIIPGYTVNNLPVDSIVNSPGFIPRPTDQAITFSLFFQDYLPKVKDCKMSLGLIFGTGLPFGPPTMQRHLAIVRMPPYRRVDIGFSYQIIKKDKPLRDSNPFHFMKSLWAGLEVFNLLQVNNTVSYYWVKDVTGRLYGVPNYLTNRQISLRLLAQF